MALTIVADDLTAACDTGTLFAGKAPEAERAVRPPGEGLSPSLAAGLLAEGVVRHGGSPWKSAN